MEQGQEKNMTLMDAHEGLRNRNNHLDDLILLSERLLEFFNNPTDAPTPAAEGEYVEQHELNKAQTRVPNMVQLFTETNDEMGQKISKVGDNLERVIQMVK